MATIAQVWSVRVGDLVRLAYHVNGQYSIKPRKPDPVTGRRDQHMVTSWTRRGPCSACKGRKFCLACDAEAYAGAVAWGERVEQVLKGEAPPEPVKAPTAIPSGRTLEETFLAYVNLRTEGTTEKNRGSHLNYSRIFLDWLAANHPEIRSIDDFTYSLIQEYCNARKNGWGSKGRNSPEKPASRITIENCLHAISMAWNGYRDDHLDSRLRDPFRRDKLRLGRREPRQAKGPVWGPEEVVAMVKLFKIVDPVAYPAVAVSAFTGARLWESCHLRICDVDVEGRTIQIADTPWHGLKTPSSRRLLPVVAPLAEILKEAVEARSAKGAGPNDLLIAWRSDGETYHATALTHRLTKGRKRVAELYEQILEKQGRPAEDRPCLDRLETRKLRAAFATMAVKAGLPLHRVAAYLGHADGSNVIQTELALRQDFRTLKEHYLAPPTAADLLQEVVAPLEKLLIPLWREQLPSVEADPQWRITRTGTSRQPKKKAMSGGSAAKNVPQPPVVRFPKRPLVRDSASAIYCYGVGAY